MVYQDNDGARANILIIVSVYFKLTAVDLCVVDSRYLHHRLHVDPGKLRQANHIKFTELHTASSCESKDLLW